MLKIQISDFLTITFKNQLVTLLGSDKLQLFYNINNTSTNTQINNTFNHKNTTEDLKNEFYIY